MHPHRGCTFIIAHTHVQDSAGKAPLHYAVEKKDGASLTALLSAKANPDVQVFASISLSLSLSLSLFVCVCLNTLHCRGTSPKKGTPPSDVVALRGDQISSGGASYVQSGNTIPSSLRH